MQSQKNWNDSNNTVGKYIFEYYIYVYYLVKKCFILNNLK